MPRETVILRVRPGSAEPVYGQIARQIREGIAAGAVPPGFALPSVRALASDLGVNLNTVARAYRLLEDDGFVRIRSRSGAEVIPPARRAAPQEVERSRRELRETLGRLRQAGLSREDLRRLVEREIEALAGTD